MKPKFDDTTVDLDARLGLASEYAWQTDDPSYEILSKFKIDIPLEDIVSRLTYIDEQPRKYQLKVLKREKELQKELFGK